MGCFKKPKNVYYDDVKELCAMNELPDYDFRRHPQYSCIFRDNNFNLD
jgi:hypothetical protein